jgi:hypothetical protein
VNFMTTRAGLILMTLVLSACGASGTATRTDALQGQSLSAAVGVGAPGARVGNRQTGRPSGSASMAAMAPEADRQNGGVVDDATSEPTPLPIDEPGRPPAQ